MTTDTIKTKPGPNAGTQLIKISFAEGIWVFFLLFALILAFNYYDIFALKTLYMDDHQRLLLGMENRLHATIFERNSLRALVIFPLYKLLSVDIHLARLAQTTIFYIPLSFTFYLLFRKYAGLDKITAFSACLLPAILPGQTQIPSFIDGSYTVQGLLVLILTLWAGFHFLSKESFSWSRLVLVTLLYVAAIEMMDQSIFLAPVFVFFGFFLSPAGPERKKWLTMSTLILLIAITKAIYQSLFPTTASTIPIDPAWSVFSERLLLLPIYTLPYSYTISTRPLSGQLLWLSYFLIVIPALYLADKRERVLIVGGLVWAFFAIITFLTISRGFAPRLSHISAWGIVFSLIVALSCLIRRLPSYPLILPGIFTLLILYSGISRLLHMQAYVYSRNQVQTASEQLYKQSKWPKDSQIMLIKTPPWLTGGWWVYSRGYMQFLTGRADISGVVGPEKFFYNPFTPKNRGFKPVARMAGIDRNKPVFIYRLVKQPEYRYLPMKYALQWLPTSWTLFRLDEKGNTLVVATGVDQKALTETLNTAKLAESSVAFYAYKRLPAEAKDTARQH